MKHTPTRRGSEREAEMSNDERITRTERLLAHRISAPVVSGKWIVWSAHVSDMTLGKYVGQVRRYLGIPAFARDGRFGVLAQAG